LPSSTGSFSARQSARPPTGPPPHAPSHERMGRSPPSMAPRFFCDLLRVARQNKEQSLRRGGSFAKGDSKTTRPRKQFSQLPGWPRTSRTQGKHDDFFIFEAPWLPFFVFFSRGGTPIAGSARRSNTTLRWLQTPRPRPRLKSPIYGRPQARRRRKIFAQNTHNQHNDPVSKQDSGQPNIVRQFHLD